MTQPEKSDGFQYDPADQEMTESEGREELLDSVLEKTSHAFSEESLFSKFVDFVREARLPSRFSHENLTELVRFVLNKTEIHSLPVNQEECVEWVASRLYDDPVSNERSSVLWSQIIEHIQAKG